MSNKDIWNAYQTGSKTISKRIVEVYDEVLGSDIDSSLSDTQQMRMLQTQPAQNTPDYGQVQQSDVMERQSELVEDWIHQAGYSDREGVVGAILFRTIYNFVDWNRLHGFVVSNEKNRTSLQDLINGGFKDTLVDSIRSIIRDDLMEANLDNLYYTLFGITFSESTVSVGRGELILSLFTSCKKGSVGDLEYLHGTNSGAGEGNKKSEGGLEVQLGGESVQVEVKTGKGRAVSARGGMFRKANLAIEAAVMGTSTKMTPEVVKAGGFEVLTDQDGVEIIVLPQRNNKGKVVSYQAIQDEMFTTEDFLNALKNADQYLPKLQPFGVAMKELRSILPGLEGKVNSFDEIRSIRHQLSLACLLYAYANPGAQKKGGFKYLLLIKQSGKDATKQLPASVGEGTFEEVELIDCSTLEKIYIAMQNGTLVLSRGGAMEGKALDGEGVYISYTGSDTNIGWMAGRSTMHSLRKQQQLGSQLKT